MYVCTDIFEMNGWILFMLSTGINHYSSLMHRNYTLILYQNSLLMPILSYHLCIFVIGISHMHILIIVFIFCIVTMYHKKAWCMSSLNWLHAKTG